MIFLTPQNWLSFKRLENDVGNLFHGNYKFSDFTKFNEVQKNRNGIVD